MSDANECILFWQSPDFVLILESIYLLDIISSALITWLCLPYRSYASSREYPEEKTAYISNDSISPVVWLPRNLAMSPDFTLMMSYATTIFCVPSQNLRDTYAVLAQDKCIGDERKGTALVSLKSPRHLKNLARGLLIRLFCPWSRLRREWAQRLEGRIKMLQKTDEKPRGQTALLPIETFQAIHKTAA